MPLHFEQQNATTTFFLAALPEKGQALLPAFTLPTKDFKSPAAFLAQFPQHTLKTAVCSRFTAFPEKGHLSFTAFEFFGVANKKTEREEKDRKRKKKKVKRGNKEKSKENKGAAGAAAAKMEAPQAPLVKNGGAEGASECIAAP